MDLSNLKAYELIDCHTIPDVESESFLLRHKKSGARVAILSNEDENKVFYIGFRTTPTDETGVPHIIEHTTLCGSDKYPVKDPFVELVKGSLNTFLNAMTYPDKTVYPLASYNDQDFKNLVDVYLDAVFHPNITKYQEIFKQEGWHYELEDPEGEISVNGVVYNEMKGAYSSAEEVLQTQIYKSLFPDNTYSQDSGGNPVHIPELTYQAYLDFYHKYYHPSNSYIYFYGDMDAEVYLEALDRDYLSHYDYQPVDSEIKAQASFDQIVNRQETYSCAADDPTENRTYLSYNRVIGDSLDNNRVQAFDVLDYALVSAAGAPVKQALIDAGIGEDVYSTYESGVKQPVFSIVAKNANPEDGERFQSIIQDTLQTLVKEGISKESLLAGINSTEFRFREADYGQFPKGLLYGLSCMDTWLYDDGKPFQALECLDSYNFLRSQLDTGYFENLIQEYLLDNTHGSYVVVGPEPGKNDREEEALAQKLAAYKKTLSPEEIQQLIQDTKHLKQYQEEPSPAEDLAKIPMLGRADMKRETMPLTNEFVHLEDKLCVYHDIKTNGIYYMTCLFEAGDLTEEEIGLTGFLSGMLGNVDTAHYGYGRLTNLVDIYTGGISSTCTLWNVQGKEVPTVKYEVRMKVLGENIQKGFDLLKEILLTSKLSDTKRLTELILQAKAGLQHSLSAAGHSVSATRGLAQLSEQHYYSDKRHGIGFYRTICSMEKQIKEDPQSLVAALQKLCDKLFAQNRMLFSITADRKLFEDHQGELTSFIQAFPAMSPVGDHVVRKGKKQKEAFTDASQISYVARCGSFDTQKHPYTGALRILKMIMGYDYLWINVRVKGGAYGCMCNFTRNGMGYFTSYRDPKLMETNQIYQGIPAYLRSFAPSERDMTKYVIGTFGTMDTPLNPEAKGSRSMNAYLMNIDYEQLQRERDQVYQAQPEDIRALAPYIEEILDKDILCVIGNEGQINQSADAFQLVEKLYSDRG